MYLVLEKQFLQRLKIILQSNIFYLILITFSIIYVFYFTKIKKYNSIYHNNQKEVVGIISKIIINDDNIKLTLKSNEDIIVTYYYKSKEEINNLKLGLKVKVFGELKKPLNNTIPNIFNYKNYLETKKIYYLFTAKDFDIVDNNISFLYRIKNYLIDRCNKIDSLGYIKSLVLGINDIDEEIDNIYKVNGIMHLFAISGMHISLLSSLLLKLLKKFIKNNDLIMIVIIIFLILYSMLIGFTPSVTRSLYMYILLNINKRFKLNISNLKIIILVIIIMILYNPFYIYDIGFLYSISTSLGLIIYSKSINKSNKIISLFKISLIANIFSLPITINNNYQINILTLVINILVVPLVSYIIYPLCLLTLFIPLIYSILKIGIIILELISKLFYKIKFLIIIMPKMNIAIIITYYFFLLLIIKYNKRIFKLFLFLVLIFNKYSYLFDNNAYIYFFDVGQGDSSLIVSSKHKEVILIDTGGLFANYYPIENIINFLKSIGITKINYLILTHGDYDHMGYSSYLINNYKVKNVIFNNGTFNDLELELIDILYKKNITYYQSLEYLNIANSKLYFLNKEIYNNENDNSSVLYLKLSNYKFIFMGDASIDVENKLIKTYSLNDIDVLKVGHHGSKTSSSKDFINYINPKYSIISVGKNNLFGHPNKEVLKILEQSEIFRTDKNGSIEFKITKENLLVKYYLP